MACQLQSLVHPSLYCPSPAIPSGPQLFFGLCIPRIRDKPSYLLSSSVDSHRQIFCLLNLPLSIFIPYLHSLFPPLHLSLSLSYCPRPSSTTPLLDTSAAPPRQPPPHHTTPHNTTIMSNDSEKINTNIVTLTRFLNEEQVKHPEASGDFTSVPLSQTTSDRS